MNISPLAGHPAPAGTALDVTKLITAYYSDAPDPAVAAQRVAFGTSGHRGTSFDRTFNEQHLLAISEAICRYRKLRNIDGPLFLGIDTHALSVPACATALEVLAAHGVDVMLAGQDEFTPTPAVSRAIICYNRGRTAGFADGIVITPSHNPPDSGGFKYNPPSGGPADSDVTQWIEREANDLLDRSLDGVKRVSHEAALTAETTHRHDFIGAYVDDLASVVDLESVRAAGLHLGVDPLGGAGVRYWPRIAEQYHLDLTIVSDVVDPTFAFMPLDWDGRIRTDPSSIYAMRRLIELKDKFDVAFACDADHDRHGIVTPGAGLMPSNHYLAAMIQHLFTRRPAWSARAGVGKTVVSSGMIDRVTARLDRELFEVPVGFKWFVGGLVDGSIAFCGEESAGATFVRRDGTVWTTDKDGIVAALLSAEITANAGKDPAEVYAALARELGNPAGGRLDAAATVEQKGKLGALEVDDVYCTELAGEPVTSIINKAPGNGAPIGGVRISTASGWFAARPSGTEALYKIYAESFRGEEALGQVMKEAQAVVDAALGGAHTGP